jgi:hypothetical protein
MRNYRVFIASPGDVKEERDVMSRVIDNVNRTDGRKGDYAVELIRWETHAAPGGGSPQQVINDLIDIGDCHIFIGIMWRRFGTPTASFGSGTEEEFDLAYKGWTKQPSMSLMFYFCQRPFMPRDLDEVEQMRRVLAFRAALRNKTLDWEYSSPEEFSQQIARHLRIRVNKLVTNAREAEAGRTGHRAEPDENAIAAFRALWPRMDPELQRAFSVAYNENRRAGDAGIQTRDLFAAMLRVRPPELQPIVEDLPVAALPEPTEGAVADQPYVATERPWLSHCVTESIKRLNRDLPAGRSLTTADIFADIAKNGSGESVRLLRAHNIGPAEIDQILVNKGIDVVRTDPAPRTPIH